MSTFYVKIKDTKHGPFDAGKLKQLAGAGKIARDDLISRDGDSNWVKASNVKGLFTPSEPKQAAKKGISSALFDTLSVIGEGISTTAKFAGKATAAVASSLVQPTNPGFLTRRRRIAITGLAATGKTVFLTTLINHLKHHDSTRFHLFDKDVTAKVFTEKETNDGFGKFDHSLHAKAMQTGRWPHKTVDVSSYACGFKTDYHWVDYQVEFLDWPGERVADMAMYKRDYAEWSDRLLKYWEVDEQSRRKHVDPYLAALQQAELSEKSILADYRLALGHLILDYNPMISPSCYLVGRDGNRLRGKSAEQLGATGVAGLNAESQFAPLPKEVRQRQPDLSMIFSQRYSEYRQQVVCSLANALRGCNRLIVLLDIPAILASGHGMLNDNCQMVDDMLAGLDASAGSAKRIIRGLWQSIAPASWMWPGIEKIAFVANKADLVAGEVNRNNMGRLLKEMLRSTVSKIEGVQIGYFVASPVNSTAHPADGPCDVDRLIGKPMFDEQGKKLDPNALEKSFVVSRVPEKWPERRWSNGEFAFPEVYPALPPGTFQLPKHIGLDEVLRFILE